MKLNTRLVVGAALATVCSGVFAGGFMLTEQSVAGMGRAQAGAGMVGDDLCAAWFNPAGMTLLSGTQVQAGGAFTYLDFKYEGVGGDHNGRKGGVAIPEAYFTDQINDNLWFGLALVVPYGMETEYRHSSTTLLDAMGKTPSYQAAAPGKRGLNAKVISFNLNPSVAYKVSEKVSVGAGVSMQYAYANFQNGVSGVYMGRFKGNDIAFGMNFGAMWKPVETIRLGLAWRSAVKHNVKGDFEAEGAGAGLLPGYQKAGKQKASLLFRSHQNVALSGAWDATPQWTFSGMIRWTDWSTFKSLNIKSRATNTSLKEEVTNYRDSWLFSLGADYKYTNDLTLRAGIAYETSAQKNGHDRLATIPENDRLWLSVGAGYKYNQNLKFDFGYLMLKCLGPAGIYEDNDRSTPAFGSIKRGYAHLLGAQMVYKF